MKPNYYLMCIACLLLTGITVIAQDDPVSKGLNAITEEAVRGQLEFLASDWTQGRGTGTPGNYMAADYIASIFKIYGLQPGGDEEWTTVSRSERMEGKRPEKYRTFYQNVDFIEYSDAGNHEFSILSVDGTNRYDFDYETDFQVRPSDVEIKIEAPVVFVGYGYVNKEHGYDDFRNIDVKNKVILCLSGYPGYSDTTSKAYQTFNEEEEISVWRLQREKNRIAKEKGALAVIAVDPGTDPMQNWADNIPFRYNTRMYEGDKQPGSYYNTRMKIPGDTLSDDLATIFVSTRVLNELTEGSGINITQFAGQVKNTLKPASKAIQGKKVYLKTNVHSRIVKARNVIGMIPGKDTGNIIVIGGHYDHLGMYDGYIWNGADDNASGTVGVMTIAKAFIATGVKPEKTIVFAAWTGEEKGLLGSTYFTNHLPVPDKNVTMYLNYDMISRDNIDDTLGIECRLMYTSGYKSFEENTHKFNEEHGFGLGISFRSSPRPSGGSDHAPFARKDIPIIYFMAGFPPEYHQPDDHIELVNWDKLVKIIKLGFLNIWEVDNGELKKEEVTEKESE
jgi:hypothetical protein